MATPAAELIRGGAGADVIDALGGGDLIYGEGGQDTIRGGDGDDVLHGGGQIGGLSATRVATGFAGPLFAASPPGDPQRLFVVEQHTGRIRILDTETGATAATPFLDIPDDQLSRGGEQGLLGLAFHPDYATNGKFYVNLTNPAGDTEVWEYRRSADADLADPNSRKLVMTLDQPFENHNGGCLAFGPDGLLYIASGDGGGANDTLGLAQNADSPFGKILRVDVNGDDFPNDPSRNYAIPPSNPFVGAPGADEVWATGLRNPWRFSFDSGSGDLFIGDVGQDAREEIDYLRAGSGGGANFGWNVREGGVRGPGPQSGGPFADPIVEYGRSLGVSVTGGYVYRGPGDAGQGLYVFGDFASGRLFTFTATDGAALDVTERAVTPDAGVMDLIASFATDGLGRLYVIGLDGEIFRLTPTGGEDASADTLFGGAGDDRLYGDGGDDVLYGEAGADLIDGGSGADYVDGGAGADRIHGGDGSDVVLGGAGSDLLLGEAGDDQLSGGDDGDFILGGAGDDRLDGGAGVDLLGGETGDDRITGGGGGDNIYGGGGSDQAFGESGDDFISGQDGDDVIGGNAGADVLHGGAGKDRFIFWTGDSVIGSSDRILDFASGSDILDFRFMDADATRAGQQSFTWAGYSDAPTGAGTLRLGFIEGVGIFIFGYTDGDGVADFLVDIGTFGVSRGDLRLSFGEATAQAEHPSLVGWTPAWEHSELV